ncbi:MAG: xylulokinase [Planctomycetes bacterium]|jgi:xylulokinase|nr:xylulokinase [Planctomycetota bacterium]
MDHLLGIDVGTTGVKAVLVRPDGSVAGEVATEHPLSVLRPGWAEQNPDDWYAAATASIRRVLDEAEVSGSEVAAVGLTGQMHGLVLLDGHGRPLRPAILWNDQRTAAECREITARIGAERLIAVTGKPALTGFTAGKLLWMRRNEPALFARGATVLLPKDSVRHRLTGVLATDVSDASGTNLFEVGARRWSTEIAEALGVPAAWLPEVFESRTVCAAVSGAAAAETGLLAGTPVVAGAGDQAAQALGTGIEGPGVVSVTIGTSGVVFAATGRYTPDPSGALHAYCHASPGRWHLMGVTLAAGGSLRWFRDALCAREKAEAEEEGRDVYDLLTDEAAWVPPGAEGLLFLPYLSGERTPHADPDARGVFFGLSLRHGRGHLTRAILEGVAMSLRDGLALLAPLGVTFDRLRLSGGGSRSVLWRQVLADMFAKPVVEVSVAQGASFGAALLAGVGVRLFPDVAEACRCTIRETGVTKPGPDAEFYDRLYPRYRALYPALREEFARLATIPEI